MLFFQEIEPRCGEALCKLFPSDDNVDLNEIVREARRSKRPDFRFSNRGRDTGSFRGRGDFRLGLFELFNLCGRGVTIVLHHIWGNYSKTKQRIKMSLLLQNLSVK